MCNSRISSSWQISTSAILVVDFPIDRVKSSQNMVKYTSKKKIVPSHLFCSSIKLYLILVWFILSSSADLGVQFRGKGERFLVKLRVAVLSGRYRGNREM